MMAFAIAAGLIAAAHILAAWERPRPAVIASGVLWLLYAVYEHEVAVGVLCDANCNIRVDLVLLFPVLGLTTFCAYRSFMGRSGQMKIIAAVLGIVALIVLALFVENSGYVLLSGAAVMLAVAIGFYAFRKRPATDRS